MRCSKAAWSAVLFIVLSTLSCKKWSDPAAPQDPRLTENKYCNDPEAVNYNWNFPGVADNTICFYPADIFKGTYSFTDSVYNSQNVFDSAGSLTTYTLQVIPIGKRQLRILGFCSGSDSLKFTAERATYQASADTTIFLNDTTKVFGQFFCRTLDTLSGYIRKNQNDSLSLIFDLKVVSDTGINFHKGTAVRL